MTSLTTMSATSALMHRSDELHAAVRIACPDTAKPLRLHPTRVKALCALASVVISVSLLGSVAVGIATPATVAAAASNAATA
jgi:hypothetical protein